MPFLPPNRQRQSTEGKSTEGNLVPSNQIKIKYDFNNGRQTTTCYNIVEHVLNDGLV